MKARFDTHKTSVNGNRQNKCPKLYCALRKYGWENFTKEMIEECPVENLDEREIYWIKYFNSYSHGYNCNEGGSINRKLSNETKEKLKKASLGKYRGSNNIQFFIDDVLYSSLRDASEKLDVPAKTIYHRLNSKNLDFSNYCYKNQSKIPNRKKRTGRGKPFFVDGQLFSNLNEAATQLDLTMAVIWWRLKSNKFSTYFYKT